jgi:hypothetical protein
MYVYIYIKTKSHNTLTDANHTYNISTFPLKVGQVDPWN